MMMNALCMGEAARLASGVFPYGALIVCVCTDGRRFEDGSVEKETLCEGVNNGSWTESGDDTGSWTDSSLSCDCEGDFLARMHAAGLLKYVLYGFKT